MKDEKINMAIAEACGWDFDPEEARSWVSRGKWVKPPFECRSLLFKHAIPNYVNDLNAMHEAEKALSDAQYWGDFKIKGFSDFLFEVNTGRSPSATARQRAEAFLRTIGKWKEEA